MCTALENLRKQGIEQGVEQGIQLEKKEIAKISIKKGLEINVIADITGLTIKEIEELVVSQEA